MNGQQELEQRVEAFRIAGDTRDVSSMEALLHDKFRLMAFMDGAADAFQMDKASYMSALAAGKLGGVPRSKRIVSLQAEKDQAACTIQMESKQHRFETMMHWVRTGEGWKLLNDFTHASSHVN